MQFVNYMLKHKKMIFDLTLNDFKNKYLGSFLGILWAFIQPSITILIFWFVFQIGFKTMPIDNLPFVVWLMTGIIPWFFFSESLGNATHAITSNGFLVKKVVFKVSLLPVIKIFSSLIVHCFFLVMLLIMLAIYGFKPNLNFVQIGYYLVATLMLSYSISLITSTLNVFFKDTAEIVGMCIQFGFWLTPIFWSFDMVPEKYSLIFKLNPFFYIVEGYRNALLYNKWFWEDIYLTCYFWSCIIFLLTIGVLLYKKLRPHFADVL